MQRYIIVMLLAFSISFVSAQEILTGLQYNEAVRHEAKKLSEHPSGLKTTGEENDTIQLPFFDDFSTSNIYPDQLKWDDRATFINKDFPLYPTNTGAATFDAIDSLGKIYDNANWIPFEADVMTSQHLRLDSVFTPITKALGPEDSLYLSFYYQPQGVGDEPEPWDTLVLEFSYPTGDTGFVYMDSVPMPVSYYLDSPEDTLRPLDTLWAPPGCDPDVFMINFQTLTWEDWVMVPCDSVFEPTFGWRQVWHAEGMKLKEFRETYGRDFVQVMIPVYDTLPDTIFFYNGFQFRFRNYASIANDIIQSWRSNVDQWNVDYVYLNFNRNIGDTTYRVISFSQRAPSFLKDYQSMPYRQYRAGSTVSLLKSRFEMYITNLDDVEHNTTYEYSVQQVNGNFGYVYYGGVCNLQPFDLFGFQTCSTSCGTAHACPPVNSAFNFDYSRDTTSYLIKHYISDSSDADIIVDSVIYQQGFYNYFAYDDGTPELGYGIEPAGAQLAYKFSLSMPDTLRGVQMYFNRTQDNANEIFFNLKVWRDNNGQPGELIYTSPSTKPQWADGLYKFYPYMFDEPLVVSGTFYVGWQQQAQGSMNIGFDANNDNSTKIFYQNEQTWYNSIFPGSLLIRPIIGQDMILSTAEKQPSNEIGKLSIYPNPSTGILHIDQSEIKFDPSAELYIYNVYGSLVHNQQGISNTIDISKQPPGMYFVKVKNLNNFYSAKLLINH